jgi:hypothetical protein
MTKTAWTARKMPRMKMMATTPTTIGTNLGEITVTTNITLGYWRTRAGEKVRVVCVDKPGRYPVVACTENGDVKTYDTDGKWSSEDAPHDLIAPWVDPPVVRECWGLFTEHGFIDGLSTKEYAERVAHDGCWASPPTIHHMREVNPEREAAVEKVVKLAQEAILYGCAYLAMKQALEELDKAGGL